MSKSTTSTIGKKPKARAKKTVSGDKKIKALEEKLESLEKQVDELTTERDAVREKNVRLLAEFDNFRRRTANERSQLLKYSYEGFATALLPVLDDLARTIASTPKTKSGKNPLLEGIIMVKEKFDKLLLDNGIKPFDAVGEKFDTEFHEALMSRETEEGEDNIILDEFEKGYKYHDRVIRHAKVIVSKVKRAVAK